MITLLFGAVCLAGLVASVYETHDEIYDDDREDSLIDSPWLAGLAALFFASAFVIILLG